MQFALKGRWLAAAATLAAGTAGAARPAAAQSVTLAAQLTNSQEVVTPPAVQPATGATGFGTLTYNQALGTIFITLRASGLGSNTVAVGAGGAPGHVHLGGPTANGAIVIPVTAAPVGSTGFSVSQSYTFADLAALGISSANIATLTSTLNGLVGAAQGTQANLYFNVHTTVFGGGEIRGNLAVVPEPATVALVGAGLVAVGAAARRRRQRA